MAIGIIDFGVGNPDSIGNMLHRIGTEAFVSAEIGELERATALILPGVGAFDHGMENLELRGLASFLSRQVVGNRVPLLGICLGAQLLTRGSEEGKKRGFGWLAAETIRFRIPATAPEYRVPHMGWADVQPLRTDGLFCGMEAGSRFYFAHSYHFSAADPSQVVAETTHGYRFPCALVNGNVFGVQFHPEKSHRFGMDILKNFTGNS